MRHGAAQQAAGAFDLKVFGAERGARVTLQLGVLAQGHVGLEIEQAVQLDDAHHAGADAGVVGGGQHHVVRGAEGLVEGADGFGKGHGNAPFWGG